MLSIGRLASISCHSTPAVYVDQAAERQQPTGIEKTRRDERSCPLSISLLCILREAANTRHLLRKARPPLIPSCHQNTYPVVLMIADFNTFTWKAIDHQAVRAIACADILRIFSTVPYLPSSEPRKCLEPFFGTPLSRSALPQTALAAAWKGTDKGVKEGRIAALSCSAYSGCAQLCVAYGQGGPRRL